MFFFPLSGCLMAPFPIHLAPFGGSRYAYVDCIFFSSGRGATASVSVTFASAPHSVTTTAEILHGQTGSVGPEDLRRPTVDGRNPAAVYR